MEATNQQIAYLSQTDTFSSQVHKIANICKYMKRKGANDANQNQNLVDLFPFLKLKNEPNWFICNKME